MIWSVSTLLRFSGTPTPVWVENLSMEIPLGTGGSRSGAGDGLEVGGRGERASHGRRRGHERRDQGGTAAPAPAPPGVAVGGRRGALAGLQGVGVHAQAHRAARAAPLGAGLLEDDV